MPPSLSHGGLAGDNVIGTQSALQLAAATAASFHYVSTISVLNIDRAPKPPEAAVGIARRTPIQGDVSCASERQPFVAHDLLDRLTQPFSGYAASKWVSEYYMQRLRSDGERVFVYRPGFISGHSRSGVCNPNDYLSRLLRTCVIAESFPVASTAIDLNPVDFVAQQLADCFIVNEQRHALTQPFASVAHLVALAPPTFGQLAATICGDYENADGEATNTTMLIRPMPYAVWRQRVAALAAATPGFIPLAPLLSAGFFPEREPLDSDFSRLASETATLLRSHARGTVQCDFGTLLLRQVRYLRQAGSQTEGRVTRTSERPLQIQ